MTAQSSGWGAPCSGQIVTVARADGVRLPVRRELAELIAILCDQTEKLGYNLVPGWCWGYACRRIRGSTSWSNHAWGKAVDLNAPENPMGPRNGKIRQHPRVIALWKTYGFRWGGDYSGRADDMHFEFMGTPADAAAYTSLAKRTFVRETGPRRVFRYMTEAEERELLQKVRELHAFAFESTPEKVAAVIPRGKIKSQVDLWIAVAEKLGVSWK